MNNIYLAGKPISAFGARLRQNYTVSGTPMTATIAQGKNDSRFFLLDRENGLLTVTLPLDFYGKNVREIAGNMAYLRGLCQDMADLDLGDGFHYRLCLTGLGEMEWTGDVLCSQTFTLQGMRLGEKISAAGAPPLTLYNPGTWKKTACRLTLSGYRSKNTDGMIFLRRDGKSYLTWRIGKNAAFSGGTLILDGTEKTNTYDGGALPEGSMLWTEYPWLPPGESRLLVTGCEISGVEVEWEPGFV